MKTSFFLFALTAPFAVACSSGSSFDVAPPGDSGVAQDTATIGDAPSNDAPSNDAPSLDDVIVPALRWCVKNGVGFTFCDDFDDGKPLGDVWDRVSGQGTLQVVSIPDAPSNPNVFDAKIVDQTQAAVIAKTFPAPTQHVSIEADLRIVGATVSNGISFLILGGFELPTRDVGYAAFYIGNDGQLGVLVGQGSAFPNIQASGTKPPIGQWAGRFKLDVSFGDAGRVQLFHDGSAIGNAINLPKELAAPTGVSAEIGIEPGGTDGVSEVEFDDVIVDVK